MSDSTAFEATDKQILRSAQDDSTASGASSERESAALACHLREREALACHPRGSEATEGSAFPAVSRRSALKAFALAPLAGAFEWSRPSVDRATKFVESLSESAAAYTPKFYTAHEWRLVRTLADIIIPKDERSGSATDAKAPEFMDFMLAEKDASENNKVQMRGGLAWIDAEMRSRFGTDFLSSTNTQRTALLDDIAYTKRAKPELRRGAAFFDRFRSSVAGAFFSSQMGWKDVQYIGNVFNPNWNGCPPEATKKLGVSYEEFDASIQAGRSKRSS